MAETFSVRLEARIKNDELVKAREQLGLSQNAVAAALDCPCNVYGQYERMLRFPPPNIQADIIGFFRDHGIKLKRSVVFPKQLASFQPQKRYVVHRGVSLAELTQRDTLLLSYDGAMAEVESRVQQEQLAAQIEKILPMIARRSRDPNRTMDIIRMRFGLGNYDRVYSLNEIAATYHITPERVRQVEGKLLRRLRDPKYSRILRTYV